MFHFPGLGSSEKLLRIMGKPFGAALRTEVVRLSRVFNFAGRFFRSNRHSADGILVFGQPLQNRKCLSTCILRIHCVISSCLGGASADVRRSVRVVRHTWPRFLPSSRSSALWPRSDANGSSLSCGLRLAAPLGRKQPG